MTETSPTPPHDERCPVWCVVEHRPDDHPDDRRHESASVYIAATVPESDAATSSELMIVTSRRFGELNDWTFIGEPDVRQQSLQLSRESALRLALALLDHVRRLDTEPPLRAPGSATDQSVDR